VAYGAYARREVADPIGWIWRRIVFFLDLMELRRSEPEVWRRREMRISVNKAVPRGSSIWQCCGGLLLSVHQGGEREECC
jgi:hypothetical protein